MSKISILAVTLSVLATLTSAHHLQPRAELGVYICSGEAWAGPCAWGPTPLDKCITLPYPESPWLSFGPDKGLMCELYYDGACTEQKKGASSMDEFQYPGSDKVGGGGYLREDTTKYSSAHGSFMCRAN